MSSRFRDALQSDRVLLMDGAMGTELLRAGAEPGECLARWNLNHPEEVRAVHRAYVQAGATCLLTNTFQSNPVALANYGLGDRLEAINQAAVDLARSVSAAGQFIIGDIGPVLSVNGPEYYLTGPEDYYRALVRVIHSLRTADALLFETWPDLQSTSVINHACRECLGRGYLPVLVSFTYQFEEGLRAPHLQADNLTDAGEDVRRIQRRFRYLSAVGVNCGRNINLDTILCIVRTYRKRTLLPLLARPNAGSRSLRRGEWIYPLSPQGLAERLPELLEAGVQLIGGCCGTTPEHIAAMRPIVDAWNARHGKN